LVSEVIPHSFGPAGGDGSFIVGFDFLKERRVWAL
jgi:hypothetical protein